MKVENDIDSTVEIMSACLREDFSVTTECSKPEIEEKRHVFGGICSSKKLAPLENESVHQKMNTLKGQNPRVYRDSIRNKLYPFKGGGVLMVKFIVQSERMRI